MKERPILFSDEMVRAILSGQKTQTRRIVKFKYFSHEQMRFLHKHPTDGYQFSGTGTYQEVGLMGKFSHFGVAGDRLWVRETFGVMPGTSDEEKQLVYRADSPLDIPSWPSRRGPIEDFIRWRPSIHMPRWASRITLEITNIRVERLNDISAMDILAEGVDNGMSNPSMGKRWENQQHIAWVDLWEKINGEGSWDENPWVWVIEFKRVKQ